jgi:hypothetical protein
MTNTLQHATWGELLHSAVHTPGKLLAAYTAFHNSSFGNALLALEQCIGRKIEPGPLNSYKGWLQLKRDARKGEKGLCLCTPVSYKKRVTGQAASETIEWSEESQDEVRQRFVFRNYWFVLAQTEGETPYEQPIPGFDLDACPSPKCRPRQKQNDSPSHTAEDETRIEPGVFADATILSPSNLWTDPADTHIY